MTLEPLVWNDAVTWKSTLSEESPLSPMVPKHRLDKSSEQTPWRVSEWRKQLR